MRILFPRRTIFRETIEVDAPCDVVFAQITDVNRWVEWAPSVASARARGVLDRRGAGFEFTPRSPSLRLKTRVLEFNPGRSLAWGAEVLGAGIEHRFDLLPIDEHRTSVEQHEYAWGIFAFLSLPASGAIRRFDHAFGQDLIASFRKS